MKNFKTLFLALCLLASNAYALTFTAAQQLILKNAALAEASIASCITNGDDICVAAWFNSATTFYVWRSSVPPSEYLAKITWTEVDALTNGKARIWEWITGNGSRSVEPKLPNVRQGIADAFSGATLTRDALTLLAKRTARKAEQLLAIGTGTLVTPGDLVVEGVITGNDVSLILRGS